MNRACLPELLDSLPPDHPDAIHNRRDLRIINRFMRNRPWFENALPPLLRPGERALEIGAGMGELAMALGGKGVPVDGLDLWPSPAGWPAQRGWHSADLRSFDGYGAYPVVLGNLIFHQFTDSELAELGGKLRRSARAIVACEPVRRRLSQVLMAAVAPFFGANHVTLHDAHVSVTAGFRGNELALALGLDDGWRCTSTETGFGVYRMVA
ncbi:MAG TPA: hypothetical protein VII43_02975, partial [Opitutaceae bacterium]